MYDTDELIDHIRVLEAKLDGLSGTAQGELNDTANELPIVKYTVEPRFDGKGIFFEFRNKEKEVIGGMTEEEAVQLIDDIKQALKDRD